MMTFTNNKDYDIGLVKENYPVVMKTENKMYIYNTYIDSCNYNRVEIIFPENKLSVPEVTYQAEGTGRTKEWTDKIEEQQIQTCNLVNLLGTI